jgi:hypothetical protein
MIIEFSDEVWFWKGPAPWYFLTVPEGDSREIKKLERLITYGWGMIPVVARIGDTQWKTALWPKDGRYILPLNVAVRSSERLQEGDSVFASIEVG